MVERRGPSLCGPRARVRQDHRPLIRLDTVRADRRPRPRRPCRGRSPRVARRHHPRCSCRRAWRGVPRGAPARRFVPGGRPPTRGDVVMVRDAKPPDDAATYPMTEDGLGTLDDAALVSEVAGGSHDALAVLYDRHADAVFASATRLTSDRGLAEEVVQETFLALWNRAETYDPAVGSLAAWLYTIARNRTVDRLRAAGRRPTLVPLSSAASPGSAFGSGSEPDADAMDRVLASGSIVAAAMPTRSPELEVALKELRSALQDALADMPEPERLVIVMAYAGDLSQTEIEERLGWPLGTVKTRTRRALLRLRETLGSGVGPEFTRYLAPVAQTGPDS